MIKNLCRKRGNGLLKCLVAHVIVFGAISIYLAWNKWSYSYVWGPNVEKLIPEVDAFFWGILQREELSTNAISANLSDTFKPDEKYLKQTRASMLKEQQDIKRKNNRNLSNENRADDTATVKKEPILPLCPLTPPKLQGWMNLPDFYERDPLTLQQQSEKYPNLADATSKPKDCQARNKVAIIIPLRGRELQLRGMLEHMHPVWQRQQMDYTVYTITQSGKQLFNRAKLMNVGFAEAIKDRKYDCYVFHDVDLLLENDKCLYWCPPTTTRGAAIPRHLSTYIDKFGYAVNTYSLGLCSPLSFQSMEIEVFGGVSMFTEEQFITVNGFSNIYWGWGAEDDDIYMRTRRKGYTVYHDTSGSCSYHMIYHNREKKNPENAVRFLLLKHALSRQNDDGLNSLRYKVLSREKHSIYTNITVDIGGPSRRLRELTREMNRGTASDDSLSCFESMVWMYNQLVKNPTS